MAVFGNTQIKHAIKTGQIICHPFNEANIGYASLDITLGSYFYRLEKVNERTVYNVFDREHVERYFEGPFKAITHQELCNLDSLKLQANIPPDHPVIAIKPGERILAHSHEFIGILSPGACEVKGRSSWARNGIAIGFDASWVNPGYINRLTLTIYNLNERETILLPVGEKIAQVIFYETNRIDGTYGTNSSDKYQQGTNLKNIMSTWSPDQMLPKSYIDKRKIPPKITGISYE